ncbi:MAG: hypothetical protein AAFU77_08890 [Myxococcota bacterium]
MFVNDRGKVIFQNPETSVQVVVDINGYFRVAIPDPSGEFWTDKPLDMLGKAPVAAQLQKKTKWEGKGKGKKKTFVYEPVLPKMSGPELEQATHFNIIE